MSVYDDRIVRLGFDNAKFESGASKSMKTLDQLNEKLKLKGAQQGAKDVQKEIDGVNFSSMEKAIERIEHRFSVMGIAGMNVINKITDGIVGSVKKLEQATIGQIKSGGWARAMNIANAKFQIEGLGFAWEQIEKAVSYGVKDTAYGLDAAASAASQLAASGVDFQEALEVVNGQELTAMHKSLRGISGVAAMTNSSYEDIARIFTTVAGNGRLMGDQLLQLSTRGMNVAAKLAETLDTTESEIRDMVSGGLIDFQTFAFAMDDAFGQHAKDANKTFTGAMSNMKAALSRVGEIFADPIINKTNTLFIALTGRIDEFKNKLKSIKVPASLEEIKKQYDGIEMSAAAYDEILKSSSEKTITFGKHFAEMWEAGIEAFSEMIKAVDIGWFDNIIIKLDNTTTRVRDFFNLIRDYFSGAAAEASGEAAKTVDNLTVTAEEAQAARDIILKGMYGNGAARKNQLTELFGEESAKNIQRYIDSVVAAGWSFENAAIKVADGNEQIAESVVKTEQAIKKQKLFAAFDNIRTSISNLFTAASNVAKAIGKIGGAILRGFSSAFKIDSESVTGSVSSITEALAKFTEKLIISDDTADKVAAASANLFGIIKQGLVVLKDGAIAAKDFIISLKDTEAFQKISDSIVEFFENIKNGKTQGSSIGDKIAEVFSSIKSAIEKFKDIPDKLSEFISGVSGIFKNIPVADTTKLALLFFAVYSLSYLFSAILALGKIVNAIAMIPVSINTMIFKIGEMFRMFKWAGSAALAAKSLQFAAQSIVMVAGVIVLLANIDQDKMYSGLAAVIVIAAILRSLTKSLGGASGAFISLRGSLAPLAKMSAALFAAALLITSVGIAVAAIAGAMALISEKFPEDGTRVFWTMAAIFAGIAILVGYIARIVNKLLINALQASVAITSFSLLLTSVGWAFMSIATAMATLSLIPLDKYETTALLAAEMLVSVLAILLVVGHVPITNVWGAAIMFAALGGVMLELATMVSIMSVVSDKRFVEMVDAMGAIIVSIIGLSIGVMVASTTIGKNMNSAGNIIATFFGLIGVITAVTAALMVLSKIEDLKDATDALVKMIGMVSVIILALGTVVSLFTILSGGYVFLLSDVMLQVAIATMAATAGMFLFATALDKIANIGDGLTTAAIAFGIFAGVIIVLAGISAFFPQFGTALEKVGNTFLAAGLGAALFGASALLLAAGVKVLSGALGPLSIGLEAFFTVLENHALVATIVTVAIIAIMATIVYFASQLAPIAKGIASLIQNTLTSIGKFLSAGASKFSTWMSTLTTRGKSIINAMVVALCAALMNSSPQMIQTIGMFIIRLLSYLGSIAGDIAEGLVELLINLINGLADAIRLNSSRIVAAFNNVVIALLTLLIDVVGALLGDVLTLFGGDKIAKELKDKLGEYTGYLNRYAEEERRMAEAADATKKEYVGIVNSISDETVMSSDKASKSLGGLGNKFGDLTGIIQQACGTQKSELSSLKEQYNDLPGYAYDAILRSMESQNKASSKSGSIMGGNLMSGISGGIQNGSDMPDMESLMGESGWSAEGIGDYGSMLGGEFSDANLNELAVPNEYYDAQSENMDDGTIKAIEDSKDDVKKAIKENVNEPANITIRSSRQSYYDAAEYCITGLVQSFDDDTSFVNAVGRFASRGDEEFKTRFGIESPSKVFYKNGEYIVAGLVNGLEASSPKAINEVSSIGKSIMGSFSEPVENLSSKAYYSASSRLIDGFTQAVKDNLTYSDAIFELSESGKQAFLSGFKMKVPTDRYFENGESLVNGIVNGIDENMYRVFDSVSGLNQAIITAFGDPIAYCSKIASGELTYVPRIRPVVDSSSVSGSAASIGAMFDNQAISINGVSGRLAADIGTLDQSNAAVVNELRELRADMALMTEQIANMQMVMDTGALVGQISGPIDRELGRRAVFRGRGN